MKIQLDPINSEYQLSQAVVRKVGIYCEDDEQRLLTPHLQAVFERLGKAKNQNLDCRLTYFSKNDEFLGFDTHSHWGNTQGQPIHISMAITAPEGTERAILNISESATVFSHKRPNEWLDMLIFGMGIGLVVFGLIYFMGD